ncbi:DUF305 domain-containing protein [Deinococcus sp. HMF7604]|uniref:DUF305 domain-containing protein n=1 Tax=Deinococcus betulae TaxID=2873312 RepID=UPI001CCA689C|nr:DUF305 domain-containing protein [Deinococcus betulae]MBZ9750189.1 DUF305 domain-containing protein [Deinococcus betulae]
MTIPIRPMLALLLCGSALAQTDHSAHGAMTAPSSDRTFLSGMVAHHVAAVQMSKLVLATTKNAQVKGWAQTILKAQEREIRQMNTLLAGGRDTAAAARMTAEMASMLGRLKAAAGVSRDRVFVQGMVGHHASAVTMATGALTTSRSPAVLKLARDIVRAQAQEIYDFQLYLNR